MSDGQNMQFNQFNNNPSTQEEISDKKIKKPRFIVFLLVILFMLAGLGIFIWKIWPAIQGNLYNKTEKEYTDTTKSIGEKFDRINERVVSDMVQIRTAAEMIYDQDGSYNNLNCNHPQIASLCADINEQIGARPVINSSLKAYCSYVKLPPLLDYYCIDSQMTYDKFMSAADTETFCDGTSFSCPQEKYRASSTDITASWQTYRNEEYGFEVKYPINWKEEKPPFDYKGIILNENSKSPNGFDLSISFIYYDNINEVSWTSNNPPQNFDDYMNDPMFQNPISIDFLGNKAFRATSINKIINYTETKIIISHNNHIYEIGYENSDELIDQILPTFKFIK